ncbi:bifunctional 3,4-dihydroxy-2-butanone-4-phosphate synthase/GTP cyclohydrolase II [Candidatus Micrarchaeota archaeon]|nr:bifunctional 3,4-dihydroxy-2-butanone-4-phosphate synthase/GTP cyclohydrolase II [Candidatus Micrarchaeota archaeon]
MFCSVEQAIQEIKNGKMVIVVDDEERENEGDLVMAAEKVTPQAINFMSQHGRGLICAPVSKQIAHELELGQMVDKNTDLNRTAFTTSVDSINTTTGISAFDRATTILALVDSETKPHDLRRPGHVFPITGQKGGVLKRAGHTEAALDLAQLAGLKQAGVICEVLNQDGTMARLPELKQFGEKHGLNLLSIAQLISYRYQREKLVQRVAASTLPTRFGTFELFVYHNSIDSSEHVALVNGEWEENEAVLVRVHSSCLTGDALESRRCDCGAQLRQAMEVIARQKGILLYLQQEGRGIGLTSKIIAYNLQERGLDTVEANEVLGYKPDLRDYGIGAQILRDLGVKKMKLLTNNPSKISGIKGYGLEVVENIGIKTGENEHNEGYLKTKKDNMGHLL